MKKITLFIILSFALMTCPVMAEETKETASITELNDAGENHLSTEQALPDEEQYEEETAKPQADASQYQEEIEKYKEVLEASPKE